MVRKLVTGSIQSVSNAVKLAICNVALLAALLLAPGIGANAQDAAAENTDVPAAYLLGGRDLIEIRVFEHPELSLQARVEADQSVLLPIVGKVFIGGISEQDAAKIIETAYIAGGVVRNAAVTVRVVEFASKRVSVLGFVGSPGTYTLDRPSTVADLLARAGGPTPDGADYLVFTNYDTETGKSERIRLEVQDILGLSDAAQNMTVDEGDILFVPKADVFYIYGEVKQAGVFRLYPGITVEQALATAGGVTELGKASSIRRRNEDGKMKKVELTEVVRSGDVLHVPQRIF